MGIGKIATIGVKKFSYVVKKGGKYLYNESKDAFTNHTQVGRRVRSGVHDAIDALKKSLTLIEEKSGQTYEKYAAKLKQNGFSVSMKLSQDNSFVLML